MRFADFVARLHKPLICTTAVLIFTFLIATACSDEEVKPPFTVAELGGYSTDLPPMSGPEADKVELEMIIYTSPTPANSGQPRFGGELRVAWTGPVIRLDPVTENLATSASEYHAAAVGSHIFESLFRWGEDKSSEPVLVESWSLSSNGLIYTFNLRQKLRFHDSSPVTSEDVRLSLDRWRIAGSTQSDIVRKFTPTDWLQTPDKATVVITLQQPLPSLIDLLGQPNLAPYVMPGEYAFRHARQTVKDVIGTGPYAHVGWRSGDRVTVERFRDYVTRAETSSGYAGEQIAWIDRITWIDVNDPALQVSTLLSGAVDVIDGADLAAYPILASDPEVVVLRGTLGNRSVAYLNPAIKPFQFTKARLAAQAAIDVEAVMSAMAHPDLWATCSAVYWCEGPLDVRDGEEMYGGLDLGTAREMVAESEYDGETIIVLGSADASWIAPLVPAVAEALRAAGFSVEELSPSYQTYGGLIQSILNYHVVLGWYGHWAGGSPLSDPTLSESNRFVVRDKDLIDLRNRYALERDATERINIVREINQLRFKHATAILLGTFDHILPVTSSLKNVRMVALPYYANAWLER